MILSLITTLLLTPCLSLHGDERAITTPLVLTNGGTEDEPAIVDGQGMVIDLGIDVSTHDWKQDGDLWTSTPEFLAEYGLEPVIAGQIAGLFIGKSHTVTDTLIYNQSREFSIQNGTEVKRERVEWRRMGKAKP